MPSTTATASAGTSMSGLVEPFVCAASPPPPQAAPSTSEGRAQEGQSDEPKGTHDAGDKAAAHAAEIQDSIDERERRHRSVGPLRHLPPELV